MTNLNELSNSSRNTLIECVDRHGEKPVIALTQRDAPWRDPVEIDLETATDDAHRMVMLCLAAQRKQGANPDAIAEAKRHAIRLHESLKGVR